MASAADLAPVAGEAQQRDVIVERVPAASDWKLAAIRLIEALVWPVVFVAVALLFRVPLTSLLTALAHKLGA